MKAITEGVDLREKCWIFEELDAGITINYPQSSRRFGFSVNCFTPVDIDPERSFWRGFIWAGKVYKKDAKLTSFTSFSNYFRF